MKTSITYAWKKSISLSSFVKKLFRSDFRVMPTQHNTRTRNYIILYGLQDYIIHQLSAFPIYTA